MRKFYIIFLDSTAIQGEIDCSEEDFKKRIIEPLRSLIYSYSIDSKITEEKLKSDLIWI